jgi:hypothetical protein
MDVSMPNAKNGHIAAPVATDYNENNEPISNLPTVNLLERGLSYSVTPFQRVLADGGVQIPVWTCCQTQGPTR